MHNYSPQYICEENVNLQASPAHECSIYYPELDNTPGIIIDPKRKTKNGFTLIELSIVLVIIGLIVGGVMVGRDLISAAAIRAQIAQLDKYNSAVNLFQGKYGYLPGDIPSGPATGYGLGARGQYAGQGDGSGVIEGFTSNAAGENYGVMQNGETLMFWNDLSSAQMMDGTFNTATANTNPGSNVTGAGLGNYFPSAKIGNNNYVMVWSGGWKSCMLGSGGSTQSDGNNYFTVATISKLNTSGSAYASPAMTVMQAYSIDNKIDDGLPQSGLVMAVSISQPSVSCWPSGGGWAGAYDASTKGPVVSGDGVASAGSSTTCYDNGNVAGATENYSIEKNGGSGMNCALSFQLQSN